MENHTHATIRRMVCHGLASQASKQHYQTNFASARDQVCTIDSFLVIMDAKAQLKSTNLSIHDIASRQGTAKFH